MACSNYCTQADLEQLSSPSIAVRGAAGEKFAKVILSYEMSLKAYSFTRISNKGPDLAMRNPSQRLVVVEVKTSTSAKPFGQLLGRGYGSKQGSVGWLSGAQESALGREQKADEAIRSSLARPESVPVLGVQINPQTERAHIYVRVDPDAFEWREVTHGGIPLQYYVK